MLHNGLSTRIISITPYFPEYCVIIGSDGDEDFIGTHSKTVSHSTEYTQIYVTSVFRTPLLITCLLSKTHMYLIFSSEVTNACVIVSVGELMFHVLHPDGKIFNSDWFANNFIMVVYGQFFFGFFCHTF